MVYIKNSFPDTPVLQISSSMVYGTWEGVIDEQYSLGSENPYGVSKIKAETMCGENDVILRPIHIYGMGDGKFSIWMNLERQIAANKLFSLEAASCIYIDDFVLAIKNILDNWRPGIYNISYDFIRNIDAIKSIYPQDFEHTTKLGPTGKPRGSLDSSKLLETFGFAYEYKDYESTIEDYYGKYENFCQKQ
jgi:nucleoside-diphosphate-sugar epimerase